MPPIEIDPQFLLMIAMLGALYFIMIRPQRKKEKALKAMLAEIKIGDEIVTYGGLHGKITRIKDDTLLIESGIGTEKSKLKIDRSAITRVEKKSDGKKEVVPVPDFEAEEESIEE